MCASSAEWWVLIKTPCQSLTGDYWDAAAEEGQMFCRISGQFREVLDSKMRWLQHHSCPGTGFPAAYLHLQQIEKHGLTCTACCLPYLTFTMKMLWRKKGSCNVNLWLSSSLSTLLFLVLFPPTLFLVWIIYRLSLSPQHAHALFVTHLLPISNSQSWACTPSQAAQPHASAAVTEFLSPPYMFLSPPCSVLPRTQGVALQPLDLQWNSEQELAWISLSCSRTKQLFSAPPHPRRLSGGQLSASDLPSANKPCCSSAQMWWCWSRTNTNKIRFVF